MWSENDILYIPYTLLYWVYVGYTFIFFVALTWNFECINLIRKGTLSKINDKQMTWPNWLNSGVYVVGSLIKSKSYDYCLNFW